MRRCLALLLVLVAVAQATVDPCKRQPFRGRCPSVEGAPPKRSQFVLRYYSRNGECVSYPYGHCASDSSEPQLYRYKEECEDACITPPPANLGSPKDGFDQTYGTVAPAKEIPTVAEVEERAESTTPSTTLPVEVVPTTAVPRTDCERRRAAAASSKIRGGFVPVCKGNGDFEPLQCELDGRQCFCVDQSGIEIANSRTHNGVKPDCAKIEAAVRPRVQECSGDFERGPCASHMERWHYVEAEQKCKQFSYSGCGGNGNNYETERDCMGRCAPLNAPPKCAKGEPLQSKQGSIINCAKTDCPSGYKCNVGQQTSVCCPDTEKTIGLQQSTTVGDVCKLDKERGPCDKYELRFYFNAETKECKYFFWGGCEGNGNNFETIESCESTCGIAKNRGTTRHPTPRTTQGFRINQNGERTESTTPTATTSTSAPTTRQHVQTTTTRATPRTTRRPTTTSIDITPIPADEDDVVVSNRNNNFQGHPVAPVSPSVLLEGSDLSDAAADVNRCAHPRDSGTCGGQFVRWFWDDDKKTCDVFTYSGCQGNGNNFASREECFAICHKESTPDFANVCHHDVDAGECNGVFQRFAFDSESGECRPFTYGGCGGNGNNFATIAECRSRCQATVRKPLVVATNLCDHNIDVGECTGVFVRFGFDKESNDCRQFTYGGCGGNGNNFASLLECRNVCVKKACPQVTATCDMSRCQIVEDQNGCPFCSCSPVKQPLPPVPTHCAPVNENSCHEPCLLINNRRGCQECVCPKTTQATHAPQPPPTQITQQQIFGNPPGHQTGRAPASEVVVGPPASATRVAPPSPNSIVRAHDVKTVSSQQKTSEIETSRPFLPPTLNAELNEKCLQPVEVGPCKNFVDRWFFSSEDGTCRPFKYGGCAGNRNHFFTQKECEIHCARFLRSLSSENSANTHVHDSLPNLKNWVYHVEATHRPLPDQPHLTTPQPQLPPVYTTVRSIDESSVPTSPEFVHHSSSLPQAQRHPTTVQRFELPFDLPTRVRAHATTNVEGRTHEELQFFPETYEVKSSLNPSQPRQHAVPTFDDTQKSVVVPQTRQVLNFASPQQHQQLQHHSQFTPSQTSGQQHPQVFANLPTTVSAHDVNSPIHPAGRLSQNFHQQFHSQGPTQSPHSTVAEERQAPQVVQNFAPRASNQHHTSPENVRPIPRRQESANLEQASNPIPLHRPAPATYTMSHVDNYDPSRNPNLEGLSPPVDPTYFTYNSQNLGVRRQFAVNSIPLERHLPPPVPRSSLPSNDFNQRRPQAPHPIQSHENRFNFNNQERPVPPTRIQAEHNENLVPFQEPSRPHLMPTTTEPPTRFVPMRPKHIRLGSDASTNEPKPNSVQNTPQATTSQPVVQRRVQHQFQQPQHATNHGVRSSDNLHKGVERSESFSEDERPLTPLAGTIPGIRINKTQTIDLTIHAPKHSSARTEEFHQRSQEFQKHVQPFMEVARNVFENYRNGTPISKSAFMHEQKHFPSNAPQLVVPDHRSQQPDDFSSEEDEDDTNFLQSVNRRRPIAAGVSQHHEAVPLPVDNYKSPDPVLRGNQPSPYDEIAAPSAIPVSAAGVSHFEPKHEEEVLNPDLSVGRDPIPTGPVGIGRNLEPLDLDGLEEPTTVIPTTKKAVAFTVAAPPAPAQINPNVHTLRTETFDAKVVCALAPETGPCTNYIQRWFFNAQSLQCEQFSFGSCGGNQNNFADRTTCELKCMSALGSVTSQVPERCSYDKDPGFGQGYNVKWYFNMKNLRCEQFVYEGQGGNSNQFETLSDCERFCTPQPKSSSAGKVSALPTTTLAPTTQTEATEAATVSTTSIPTTEAVATTKAPASHSLRPLPEQPLSVSIDENENIESINNNNNNNEDYDSSEVDEGDLLPVPTNINSQPIPPAGLPEVSKTDDVKPPAHAAKTVTQEEVEAKKSVEKKDKDNYKAEPIAAQTQESGLDNLPRVGPSPPMKVDYQTGQINPVISGIKTFPEGRIPVDKTEFDSEDGARQNLPSCPNGLQEMRYADGRPVMCLPGKNQCPDKSVCYFNGIDFFCCPNIDDPYDKHVFGGYDGEETKHGYKIFGPLRVRRLMDEVPLRTKRQTSMDRAFNTAPVSFSIDSVIAPLRFDAEKPRSISRAARMRKPTPPQHGNPMCMLPLAKGDCQEAHLRYFYDKESDSCRLFHYSGCQGNANNFGSLEDCQRLCVLSGQPTVRQTPAPVVQEEKPTAPVGQCPVGSPLGGNAPVLCGSSTDSIGCPEGYYCRAGPPDVCCPGPNPSEPKKEIRFAPEVPRAHSPRGFRNEVLTATPIFMCPDASDPLMAENGKPQVCGSGFDGMQMCPKGYYCAIDNESGSRLCCSLLGNAERIPNQQVNAPYFGRRSSNPGEVIERGSLPTDQVTEKPLPSSVPAVDFSTIDAVVDNTKTSIPSDTSSEEYEDEEEETPEHLLLKPLSRHEKLQQSAASESPKASNLESEIVNIDMPKESTTVVEEVSVPKINPMDQTICHVKPTEGRACREDEKAPKTNLQYFYSAKDNRCKLYFYRGCGGNENRFEKKADCESLCVVKL